MLASHTLLSLILTTLTAVEASLVGRHTAKPTLSLATRINEHGGFSIVEKDRARLLAMAQAEQLKKHDGYPVTVDNTVVVYTAEVGVGSPPTNFTLIVDTGSSNTWVGAGKPYVPTNTSRNTGHAFRVRYGIGNVTGTEWNDTVTLSPDLVIRQQSIGVANASNSFTGFDGILGVGPADLTHHTISGVYEVPTVTDNLYSQGTISEEVLGIYYTPASEASKYGELTFGGYDESAIVSPVSYVPLTTTRNASRYWGINQSVSYGGKTILPSTAGIVDTGTTLIYLATNAYNQYKAKTGATFDNTTGLLKITPDQYENLEPLVFNIGDMSLVLTPNAQIWPRSLNSIAGGPPDAIYLIVADIGPIVQSSFGVDFINGYTFLERYYSVYDTTNKRVGFATTPYTFCNVN